MKPIQMWIKAMMDPRRSSRDEAPPVVAYFWDGGQPVAHTVKNVSPSGFYLATSERWPLGTLVTITLRRSRVDPNQPDSSIAVMSKAVHYGKDGVGFAFVPIDTAAPTQQPRPGAHTADRKTIDRFLRRLTADRG